MLDNLDTIIYKHKSLVSKNNDFFGIFSQYDMNSINDRKGIY